MRILIADDHGIVRGGLRLLIDRQPDMEVVAEAEDGIDAFEQALATKPDLCVMDVSMPRMTGLQAAREIRSHMPDTQVLVLSMHDDERYVFDALKAGASGYVLKREVDQALIGAMRAVHRGEAFLTTAVARSLIRDWMSDDRAGPDEPLTPREQEVLKLIAEAHTNKQIAEILHLAEKTVESHRANLLRKLGMRDRVELVPGPEHEAHPAGDVLLEQEALRARGRVVARVDGDREHGDVAPEPVERAPDRLDLRGARVLAGRVDEGHHHGAAAVGGHRDRLAVLVAQAEGGRGRAGRADRAGELRDRPGRLLAAAGGDPDARHRGGGAQAERGEGVEDAGLHPRQVRTPTPR